MKKQGFGLVEGLLLTFAVSLVISFGYLAWNRNKNNSAPVIINASNEPNANVKFENVNSIQDLVNRVDKPSQIIGRVFFEEDCPPSTDVLPNNGSCTNKAHLTNVDVTSLYNTNQKILLYENDKIAGCSSTDLPNCGGWTSGELYRLTGYIKQFDSGTYIFEVSDKFIQAR